MTNTTDSLERWKSISAIASAVAIPFVLAIVGYFIQKQLSDAGLKKDYVAIATNILKESPEHQEPDLRKWAVEVLDSNSPIPFSGKAKQGLAQAAYLVVAPPRIPGPPSLCMQPPNAEKVGPLIERMLRNQAQSPSQLMDQFIELSEVAIRAEAEAMRDRESLKCLQKYGQLVEKSTAETAAMYAKPIESAAKAESNEEKSEK